MPTAAHADATCTTSGTTTSCTFPSGGPQSFALQPSPAQFNPAAVQNLVINSAGPISANGVTTGLSIQSIGVNSGAGQDSISNSKYKISDGGGLTGTVTVTIPAITIALTPVPYAIAEVEGLYVQNVAGNGGPGYGNSGGGGTGGFTAPTTLTNAAAVTITNPGGALPFGGAGILVQSLGGNGGNATSTGTQNDGVNLKYNDGANGGNGGNGSGVTVANSGSVTLGSANSPLNGQVGAIGVMAQSTGGKGGNGKTGPITSGSSSAYGPSGANGGNGDAVNLTSTAPQVNINWNWTGAAGAAPVGVFGLLALTSGGAASPQVQQTKINGGTGGAGGLFTLGSTGTAITIGTSGTPSGSLLLTPLGLPAFEGAGIAGISQGGAGGAAFDSSTAGGGGQAGTAGTSTITLTNTSISTTGTGVPGVAAEAIGGLGGNGGYQQDHSNAGPGGAAGAVSVTLSGSTINATGNYSPAIVGISTGGAGGVGTSFSDPSGSAGAGGAGAGGATVNITTTGANTLSSTGGGIIAISQGGNGGAGGNFSGTIEQGGQGRGGAGGSGGPVYASIGGTTAITTTGTASAGLLAQSIGGFGGQSGTVSNAGASGFNGGNGGDAGLLNVSVLTGTSIRTTGADSIGVQVQSLSGGGGGGSNGVYVFGGSSGAGGTSGNAGSVIVQTQGAITTTAAGSYGILAQSAAGPGGAGGSGFGTFYDGPGNGAVSGTVGPVSVTNTGTITTQGSGATAILAQSNGGNGGAGGSAGGIIGLGGSGGTASSGNATTVSTSNSISTTGANALGVLAQSIGGGGGAAGNSLAVATLGSGIGGAGGPGGAVTITQSGSVTTTGTTSIGLEAQSIGGGGGQSGNSTALSSIGGIGNSNSIGGAGGAAAINPNGTITTSGTQAIAALSQSIGGGGGSAGSSTGLFAIGGNGGPGGSGNTSTITATGAAITTTGDQAHGLVAQSVGGGGGVGGNASAYAPLAAVAIGGKGGVGGAGGAASVTTAGSTLALSGSNAYGLVAQSVGGGGGLGGSGSATSVSVGFGASLGVGGTGGSGTNGGSASVTASNSSITTGLGVTAATTPGSILPVDAFGIVAQSVGGGGGTGGSATAKSYVANVPIPSTDTSVGVSATFGVGGSGAGGGSGGAATVNLSNGTVLTTNGQGSTGVLVQSVGGGGGAGGDSSAAGSTYGLQDLTDRAVFSVNASVTLGGAGGNGASGSTAAAYLGGSAAGADPAGSKGVTIRTNGDYADALLVQSIGGGGGNAGFGSSGTEAAKGGATGALAIKANIGSSGGIGSVGGPVVATQYANSSITTYGSSANGIVAQSIGGGGGTSVGGSYNLGGTVAINKADASITGNVALAVGGTGTSGGSGGSVTTTVNGSIRTYGGDAAGVLAQSIGGGGGIAGSAGTDASADNPVDPTTTSGNRVLTNVKNAINGDYPAPSISLGIAIGATGGSGGLGGPVTVTVANGQVATSGDFSKAVVAQSIGGGGGVGGAAVAGSPAQTDTISVAANFALGGQGGIGGTGGSTTVNLSGATLSTSGFWANGVLAQSIGGGGGAAASGSDNQSGSYAVGVSGSRSGGGGGNADAVTLNSAGSPSSIQTMAEGAHAILLQSIGGGGGLAGSGSQFALGTPLPFVSTGFSLQAGGGQGSAGNGGPVAITNGAALNISTTGNSAYGVLAQSIGGGGGLVGTQIGKSLTASSVGGNFLGVPSAGQNLAAGGPVSLSFADGSQITTTGIASSAIVAQSIGGGGGISGYVGGTPTLSRAATGPLITNGNGGAVSISTGNTTIVTSGAGAYGILAQSIGAGGGLSAGTGVSSTLYAGSTGAAGSQGVGGLVTINQAGVLQATGANAMGIFAQSIGQNGNTGAGNAISAGVAIAVNGTVIGGSGAQGYGIQTDTDLTNNIISIGTTGSVGALSGNAIVANGFGTTNVVNNGTVIGSINIHSGSPVVGTFTNNGVWTSGSAQPVLSAAATQPVATTQAFVTSVAPPVPTYATATLNGTLVQGGSGSLLAKADFAGGQVDRFVVNGNATLAGTVQPSFVTILSHVRLPVLTVAGTSTGQLTVPSTALFDFQVQPSGGTYNLVATGARFGDARFALTPGQAAVAGGLTSAFAAGTSSDYGALFAALDRLATTQPGAYASTLGQLGPRTVLSVQARRAADAPNIANASMSCPVFAVGQNGSNAFLTEGSCAYFRAGGRTTTDSGDADRGHAQLDSATWQVGGQTELVPGWFLGGSLAYETSWISTTDGLKGQGKLAEGAITLKHQDGPWLLTGGAFGGTGGTDLERVLAIPGGSFVAKGSPTQSFAGLRARAAYTIGVEAFYLRPYLNVDGIYANSGAYQEYGAGAFGLGFNSSSQTTAIITPALEVGGRTTLGPSTVLRSFLAAGVAIRTNDQWQSTARLLGANSGGGSFTTTVPMDRTAAKVTAGVQMFQGDRIELRAQYDGEYGSRATTHGGTLTFSYRL
jgi:hypothetical protein